MDDAVVSCTIPLMSSYKLTFRLVGEEALVVCLFFFKGEVLLRDVLFVGHGKIVCRVSCVNCQIVNCPIVKLSNKISLYGHAATLPAEEAATEFHYFVARVGKQSGGFLAASAAAAIEGNGLVFG